MRFVRLWLSTLVVLIAPLASAFALPVPKLPPEVTNKPSVVVRVRPLGELMKDVNYVAKLLGQDGLLGAVEPVIQPIIDAMDATKPIGFYANVGPKGIDSKGVLLLPVKNQNDILNLLKTFGQNPVEGAGGIYSVNPPGAPQVLFRHANGYLYTTVMHVPDADTILAVNKLYAPEALFKQGDDSLFSLTFNVDTVPNDLKRMVRALEVFYLTGRPLTAHFAETASPIPGVDVAGIAVRLPAAAIAERDKHKILIGAGDPRRRAVDALPVRTDVRTDRFSERGLRDRAVKRAAKVGLAVELDEHIANDILPERQSPVSGAAVCGELDWHQRASLSLPQPHLYSQIPPDSRQNPYRSFARSRIFVPWRSSACV